MMDWMYSPASLRKQIDDGHVYYLALSEGQPCGYVSVQREGITEDGRMLFHLHKIYVMPSEQGSGLGRLLFDTAMDHVRREASPSGYCCPHLRNGTSCDRICRMWCE